MYRVPKKYDDHEALAIRKLRINIKSLTAEARAIRYEIRAALKSGWNYSKVCDLHWHRITRVRREARLAHLALAFIKGVPRSVVERKAKNTPFPPFLAKKVERAMYGYPSSSAVRADILERVERWLNEPEEQPAQEELSAAS